MIGQETRLVVTARVRGGSRLEASGIEAVPEDPSIETLVSMAHGAKAPLVVVGGEPTLRPDLPELMAALNRTLTLECDGLALTREGALKPLVDAGLGRVRFALHAARPEAHDWLVGRKGAARAVVRAIGRSKAAGLGVEVVALVTRPTLALVAELVDVAASLGVDAIWLRRFSEGGVLDDERAPLAPRLGFMEPHLRDAAKRADRAGIDLALEDFPACVAPKIARHRLLPGSITWLIPPRAQWRTEEPMTTGCKTYPGLPTCAGLSCAYVDRFGKDAPE